MPDRDPQHLVAGAEPAEGDAEAIAGRSLEIGDGLGEHPDVAGSPAERRVLGGQPDAEVTGTGLNLKMTVYTDATDASEYDSFVSVGTTGIVSVPYGSFSQVGTNGPANFASVGAIVLKLSGSGNSGSDITIKSIRTSVGVPEPSTLVMAVIVVMVLLGGRCWRRTHPAFLNFLPHRADAQHPSTSS